MFHRNTYGCHWAANKLPPDFLLAGKTCDLCSWYKVTPTKSAHASAEGKRRRRMGMRVGLETGRWWQKQVEEEEWMKGESTHMWQDQAVLLMGREKYNNLKKRMKDVVFILLDPHRVPMSSIYHGTDRRGNGAGFPASCERMHELALNRQRHQTFRNRFMWNVPLKSALHASRTVIIIHFPLVVLFCGIVLQKILSTRQNKLLKYENVKRDQ